MANAQLATRTRTRTSTTTTTLSGGAAGTRQITLAGGQILNIDARTLQRLQRQGVDINNLQNLSEAELEELGISLRADTLTIPGATIGADGLQTVTLRNGIILTIDEATLSRIRAAGIELNQIQNLSESELRRIGISLSTETIGLSLAPGSTRQITLRDGSIVVIEYEQLLRLQEQGIDIDNLQALSETDLERLGIIQVTRTVTVARARPRPATATRTRITASLIPTTPRPVVAVAAPTARPPPPPRPAERDDEPEPAPEPYNFEYTAETEDGASSTHQATQTAEGVVTGFYIIKDAAGNQRRVDYVADKDGYRATVTTNEIGTESKNPADVEIQSSAPSASELSRQYTAEQERLGVRRQPQPTFVSNARGIDQRRTALASSIQATQRSARPARITLSSEPRANVDFESEGSASAAQGIKI